LVSSALSTFIPSSITPSNEGSLILPISRPGKGDESLGHTVPSAGSFPERKYSLTWDRVQAEGALIEQCYGQGLNQ
jgi:hypothetical protein